MNFRKLFLAGILAMLLSILSGPVLAMDQEAESLLKKVQKVYAGSVGFRAEYDLTFRGGRVASGDSSSEVKKTSGVMLYGSPNRLRLIQNSPLEEEMVISPEGIWWYLREDNEAHRYPASEFYALFAPIMSFFKVLGDYKELEKGYKVTRHYGGDSGKEKAIKMVPLDHGTGLDWVVILINQQSMIAQVEVHLLNGDASTYRFNTMEILSEDPEEGFGFTPPAGAKIVHH